jgi:hypothetical protein
MSQPTSGREQRLLRNARREGVLLLFAWAIALTWSVGGGYQFGYRRNANDIQLILGIPDWIFWCVVVPWTACVLFSTWFCFGIMADDDLGRDQGERRD